MALKVLGIILKNPRFMYFCIVQSLKLLLYPPTIKDKFQMYMKKP